MPVTDGGYYGGGGGGGYEGVEGSGGTQIAGGAGGAGNFGGSNGINGALGIGGDGGSAPANNQAGTNGGPTGGDGGGLTGGNGGSGGPNWRGGGGGGGSSYLGGVTAGLTTAAVQSGNGQIVITYSLPAGPSCTGTPVTFTYTVNPTATVNAVANQTVCNNASTAAVNFTSPTTGGTIVYNWTNSDPSIGLAASGSGNIPSFVATNASNAPVTATITVTPAYTNAGVTCNGTPMSFTITVNPTATVNPVANQTVCNNANTAAINFSGPVAGAFYTWTNNTSSIGLAASGSGDIPSFVATNVSNAPVTATITVTPSYGIVNPVSASSTMGGGFGTLLSNTINGAGLASFPSLSANHAATIPTNSWVSSAGI